MNKRKKYILTVTWIVIYIAPWILYDITGEVSHALYGLAIYMSFIAMAVMDCIINLKKTIKEVIKNDDENNA